MAHTHGRDTMPELSLRSEVHRRGMRYRVNCRPVQGVRRTVDLLFTRARVAVFVDGCFWHRCPDHFVMPATNRDFWDQKLASNAMRDRETEQLLSANGWTVIRIWEHEDVELAATRIESVVASRRPSRTRHR